jgi:hypothetical protein
MVAQLSGGGLAKATADPVSATAEPAREEVRNVPNRIKKGTKRKKRDSEEDEPTAQELEEERVEDLLFCAGMSQGYGESPVRKKAKDTSERGLRVKMKTKTKTKTKAKAKEVGRKEKQKKAGGRRGSKA